jgi:hypothetical protein
MFDRSKSTYSSNRSYNVLAGATIAAEGQAMIAVDNGLGGIAARVATGAASEKFIGFSRTDNIRVTTEVVVESIVVPAGGGLVNLKHGQIVSGSTLAYNVTGAVALTQVGVAPAAGEVQFNITNGTITFNAAEAGDTVTVQYRYNMTVEQSKLKHRNSLPNNIATDYLSIVGVMGGEGTMYTDQFDPSVLFTSLQTVRLGANGLTNTGAGTIIGYVTQVPSVSNSMLGVKFTVSL